MSRSLLTALVSMFLLAMTAGGGLAQSLVIPYLGFTDLRGGPNTTPTTPSSITYDPAVHKVYVGLGYAEQQAKALLVCDTDPVTGKVSLPGRRYLAYANLPAGSVCWPMSFCVDNVRHHKLYMSMQVGSSYALATFNLDAGGEPTGERQTILLSQEEMPYFLVLHPTLNRLYYPTMRTVNGQSGYLWAHDLDANGYPVPITPVDSRHFFSVNPSGYMVASMSIRPDGTKIYLGSYPYTVTVADLDAAGNPSGGRNYAVPNPPLQYLQMSANTQGVYFCSSDGYVERFPLDAAGEPSGAPIVDTAHSALAVRAEANGKVRTIEKNSYLDFYSGAPCYNGLIVREYTLNADGSFGASIASPPIDRMDLDFNYVSAEYVSHGPGMSMLVKPIQIATGNRYGNLKARVKLLSATPTGVLPASYTMKTLGTRANYLKYTYSSRYQKVYAVDSANIISYDLVTKAVATVPCADALFPWANTSETNILVDDQDGNGKLYILLNGGRVDIRTLDANGVPSETANPVSLTVNTYYTQSDAQSLVLNPAKHLVYVLGNYTSGATGRIPGTNLVVLLNWQMPRNAVVDPVKGRIYVTTDYYNQSNLWVWKLDAGGLPVGTPTQLADEVGAVGTPNLCSAITLDSAKHRLYVGVYPDGGGAGKGKIVVRTLDENGDPTGTPQVYTSPNSAGYVYSLVLSPDGTMLYEPGFCHRLDANGDLTDTVVAYTTDTSTNLHLQLTADGRTLLAATYSGAGQTLDEISLGADGIPAFGIPARFLGASGSQDFPVADLGTLQAGGAASPWVSLDAALKDKYSTRYLMLTLDNSTYWSTTHTVAGGQAQVDFSLDDGQTILTSRTVTLDGNHTAFFLPAYDATSAEMADLAGAIETSLQHHQGYLSNLDDQTPMGRPAQYIISSAFVDPESNIATLDLELQILSYLGVNTMEQPAGWYSPDILRTHGQAAGMTGFRGRTYSPTVPEDPNGKVYLNYQLTKRNNPTQQLTGWVDWIKSALALQGADLSTYPTPSIVDFYLADEPGWYYTGGTVGVLDEVRNNAAALAEFRTYLATADPLQNKPAFTPQYFDSQATDWSTIYPTGNGITTSPMSAPYSTDPNVTRRTPVERNRLFYWTTRFYADENAMVFHTYTQALLDHINPNMVVFADFGINMGRYYVPMTTPDDADAASMWPDWFALGRRRGVTAYVIEGWMSDQEAGKYAFAADQGRCAARESAAGSNTFGMLLVGAACGMTADGAKYKVMAMAGRGAKIFDLYSYGPGQTNLDSFADNKAAYKPIQTAFKFLGKCEDVLYPGKPREAGTVAILWSLTSQPWDGDGNDKQWSQEIRGLYCGLTHAHYPVDFIDEVDIETGKLESYGYKVLYVTGPNLSVAAQTKIKDWVNAGGTLVMMPGACAADEANQPTTTLHALMGASWGTVARDEHVDENVSAWLEPRSDVTVNDPATLGAASDLAMNRMIYPLTPTTATVLANVAGQAAVTRQAYGTGQIFAFGYRPGITYLTLVDGECGRQLEGWRDDTRNILSAPCRAANAGKFVDILANGGLSAGAVEGTLVESETAGIGVTLLNWTGQSQTDLTVRISLNTMPANILTKVTAAIAAHTLVVSSVELGNLTYTVSDNNIVIIMPQLITVDVLKLTFDELPQPALSGVTVQADPANIPQIGNSLAFTAAPIGGLTPEFAFAVKLKDVQPDGSSTYQTIVAKTAFSSTNLLNFTPTDPGVYTITAYCQEAGTTKPVFAKSLSYTVGTLALTGVSTFTTDQPSGIVLDTIPAAGIQLTATMAGSGPGETYGFTAKLKDVHLDGTYSYVTTFTRGFSASNTAAWQPTLPGVYTLTATIRDATCNLSYSKTLSFIVRANEVRNITSFTAAPVSGLTLDAVPTAGITLTALIDGSGAGATYFFSGKLKDLQADGSYVYVPVTLSTAYQSGNTFQWHPTLPGTYTLTVTVRDASYDAPLTKTLAFTVRANDVRNITSFTAAPTSGITLDAVPSAGITLTALVDGSATGATYFFSGKLKDVQADGTYVYVPVTLSTAYQSGNTFQWHPTLPGTYTLTVTVRDASYDAPLTKTLAFTVKSNAVRGITSFTAAPVSGVALPSIPAEGITLTATVDGSGTGATYFFSGKLKDVQADGTYTSVPVTLSTAYQAGNTFPWHPTEPGTYTLTVTVRDASYDAPLTKTLSFMVKSGALLGITSFTPSLPSGTSLGSIPAEGVQFSTVISGTGTNVRYRYQVSQLVGGIYAFTGYTTDRTYAFTPATTGTYKVTVYAYDETYNTVISKYVNYVVK